VINIKGYSPFEICKEELEIANNTPSFFLELGAMQTGQCKCKNGECKSTKNK